MGLAGFAMLYSEHAPGTFMPLTIADFGAFFEAMRNGTYKCSFCGNETFTVNVLDIQPQKPEDTTVALLLVPAGPEKVPTDAHEFYSFSCLRCGRTDFFHFNQVRAWIEKSKVAAQPEKAAPNG